MHRKELRAKRRRIAEEKAALEGLDAPATEIDQDVDKQEVKEELAVDLDLL